MIENYIKRDHVIECELDLIFIEKSIRYLALTNHCREDVDKLFIVAKTLIDFHKLLSRKRFAEKIIIRFVKRREIEQICF
jgi:hypothetical protein